MKYFFLIMIIFCGCKSSMVFKKVTDNSLINQLVSFDTAKLFFKVSELPNSTISFLKQEHVVLADTGNYYNNTDLHFDYASPNAKIVFGGWLNEGLTFTIYESQGIITQSHLIVLKTNDSKSTNVEKKILQCRPQNFKGLQNCISTHPGASVPR